MPIKQMFNVSSVVTHDEKIAGRCIIFMQYA